MTITKEQYQRELEAEMKFKPDIQKAEEMMYKKYGEQVVQWLKHYRPPSKQGFRPPRGWTSGGKIRRSVSGTLKTWWDIIKGK